MEQRWCRIDQNEVFPSKKLAITFDHPYKNIIMRETVRIFNESELKEFIEEIERPLKEELEIIKGIVGEKVPDVQTITTAGNLPDQFNKKEFAWEWFKRIVFFYKKDVFGCVNTEEYLRHIFEQLYNELESDKKEITLTDLKNELFSNHRKEQSNGL